MTSLQGETPPNSSTPTESLGRFAYNTRALNRWLETHGYKRTDRKLDYREELADRTKKLELWLRDSLLWTIEEVEAGRWVTGIRGLCQAAGYAGAVGHDSTTGDTFIALRNAFEDALGKGLPGVPR